MYVNNRVVGFLVWGYALLDVMYVDNQRFYHLLLKMKSEVFALDFYVDWSCFSCPKAKKEHPGVFLMML